VEEKSQTLRKKGVNGLYSCVPVESVRGNMFSIVIDMVGLGGVAGDNM